MFWKKEIIYTDVLSEYRKIKIWDYNLFDEIEFNYSYWEKKFWILVGVNYSKFLIITLTGKLYDVDPFDIIWRHYSWELSEELKTLDEVTKESIELEKLLKQVEEKTNRIKDKQKILSWKNMENILTLHKLLNK